VDPTANHVQDIERPGDQDPANSCHLRELLVGPGEHHSIIQRDKVLQHGIDTLGFTEARGEDLNWLPLGEGMITTR
jgi:hypothetical protein